MPDAMEYIESYFQQTLNAEERKAFETRCEADNEFAKEVAFYITTRQALREKLLAQKMQQWKDETVIKEQTTPVISLEKRKTTFGRWVVYAAAACFILAISVYLFEAQSSPQKLAANYIKENYSDLSATMDASHDSLQLGREAYKNKDYAKALQLFEGVQKTDPLNYDAIKYAGLTYLQQKNYNKALEQFDALSKLNTKFNSGNFLKALTLLERNNRGDKEAAKVLLQKVVNEKEEGSEEAAEWLNKF